MKHRATYYLIIIIIICLLFTNAAFAKPQGSDPSPLQLNNIALCYHGFTSDPSAKSETVTYLEDFKEQINYLQNNKFTFVPPSQYAEWYAKKNKPTGPIATIIFDDARESVDLAAQWLIDQQIPFGIAVIGRRLRTINPEDGYLSWAGLQRIYNTGYCEILNHTYNLHHFNLSQENNAVVSEPILEKPCYIDKGDFVYIASNDSRWYWDLTFVDETTWEFPLFGTDLNTMQPITSTIRFKAKANLTVNKIRAWASLHTPYSSGYHANVKVTINGTEVAAATISPTEYKTRSQWPEREFVTINFDRAYTLQANQTYSICFTTENSGNASFNIYAIPNFTGDFELTTSCTGMTYDANTVWPAAACIILAGDNGREATKQEFKQYVLNDLNTNNAVIKKYLTASWNTHSTGYEENDYLECLVLGGTYTDGSMAKTKIKFTPEQSFTGEALRFKTVAHLGEWYPLIIDVNIDGQKVGSFSPNWRDWAWQTINITPYRFTAGQEYTITFETVNPSPKGTGLVRIYADQQDLPWPAWDEANNTWLKPDDTKFQFPVQYEVSSLEGTDVYPSGINIDNLDYSWEYSSPYTGPGKAFLEILSCTPGKSVTPTQICYPFGAYQPKQTGNKDDISSELKSVFKQIGLSSGMTIWDEATGSLENVQSKYSEYIIPRYLVLGNIEQSETLRDIDILIGIPAN